MKEYIHRQCQAVLIKFENSVINGDRIMFNIFKKFFHNKEIEIDETLYIRLCLERTIEDAIYRISSFFSRKNQFSERNIEEITKMYEETLKQENVPIDSWILNLLKILCENNMKLGIISNLQTEILNYQLEKTGLSVYSPVVHIISNRPKASQSEKETVSVEKILQERSCFISPFDWKAIISMLKIKPIRCFSITSTRTALITSLQSCVSMTIVVPNEFSIHQDFSGADFIIEDKDKVSPEKLADFILKGVALNA